MLRGLCMAWVIWIDPKGSILLRLFTLDILLRQVLAKGVPINQGDYDGRTTLHLAASEGNAKVVEVLLRAGAKVNVMDR